MRKTLPIALLTALLATLSGCRKAEPPPPHPDLSLLDDAFEAKYFPDVVKQRDEYLRRTIEAGDKSRAARSRFVTTSNINDLNERIEQDAEAEKWSRLVDDTTRSLYKTQDAKRKQLESQGK